MLDWLLLHTLVVALLAGVVLALCRYFHPSPATRHALWLVVLLKMMTPPLVSWPWSLPAIVSGATPAVASEVSFPVREPEIPAQPAVFLPPPDADEAVPVVLPASPTSEESEAGEAPVEWGLWLLRLAGLTWLAGGLATAVTHGYRIERVQRLLASGKAAPDWLRGLVRELAESLNVPAPRVCVLPGIASPLLWAWGTPRLLWPRGVEDDLSAEGCRAVLVHELAHLRRRDHWVARLLLVGAGVWWWHPLFWLIRREVCRAAELACDAWVVGLLPGARRAYAEALLEVAERGSWTAPAAPALGVADGRRDLERRLFMIMRGCRSCRVSGRALLVAGALALLALPAWTLGQVSPPGTTPVPAVKEAPQDLKLATVAEEKPDAARDKKLQDLEARIKELMKELHALRGHAPIHTPPAVAAVAQNPPQPAVAHPVVGYSYEPVTTYRDGQGVTSYRLVGPAAIDGEVTLSRATYKLPAAKAEALATLLKDHVKGPVVETKVEGENLVVTTTPEAQRTIAQFIGLLQGKTTRATPVPPVHAVPADPAAPAPRSH
jgi:beta-lactamase regulating signal transducer with metallopeptidase domain